MLADDLWGTYPKEEYMESRKIRTAISGKGAEKTRCKRNANTYPMWPFIAL
jgi:hypothetical protein